MFETTRNFYKKTLSPKPVRRSPIGDSDEVLAELMNFCSLPVQTDAVPSPPSSPEVIMGYKRGGYYDFSIDPTSQVSRLATRLRTMTADSTPTNGDSDAQDDVLHAHRLMDRPMHVSFAIDQAVSNMMSPRIGSVGPQNQTSPSLVPPLSPAPTPAPLRTRSLRRVPNLQVYIPQRSVSMPNPTVHANTIGNVNADVNATASPGTSPPWTPKPRLRRVSARLPVSSLGLNLNDPSSGSGSGSGSFSPAHQLQSQPQPNPAIPRCPPTSPCDSLAEFDDRFPLPRPMRQKSESNSTGSPDPDLDEDEYDWPVTPQLVHRASGALFERITEGENPSVPLEELRRHEDDGEYILKFGTITPKDKHAFMKGRTASVPSLSLTFPTPTIPCDDGFGLGFGVPPYTVGRSPSSPDLLSTVFVPASRTKSQPSQPSQVTQSTISTLPSRSSRRSSMSSLANTIRGVCTLVVPHARRSSCSGSVWWGPKFASSHMEARSGEAFVEAMAARRTFSMVEVTVSKTVASRGEVVWN